MKPKNLSRDITEALDDADLLTEEPQPPRRQEKDDPTVYIPRFTYEGDWA